MFNFKTCELMTFRLFFYKYGNKIQSIRHDMYISLIVFNFWNWVYEEWKNEKKEKKCLFQGYKYSCRFLSANRFNIRRARGNIWVYKIHNRRPAWNNSRLRQKENDGRLRVTLFFERHNFLVRRFFPRWANHHK